MQETLGSIPGTAQIRHGGGMVTCTCKPSRDWESQEFKVILDYMVSSWPDEIHETLSQNMKGGREIAQWVKEFGMQAQ